MEAVAIVVVPLALLLVGLALFTGRSLAPSAVLQSMASSCWKLLRWLWKDRSQRGGAGRVKRPPVRYRR